MFLQGRAQRAAIHARSSSQVIDWRSLFVHSSAFLRYPEAVSAIDELRQTIARLRGPGGCPWDQEQTHGSLVRCLIDEASELVEAIDNLNFPHMREELGDVLIQVVFHAQLAAEAGHFTFEDVAREVNEKLIRRHPHVFGESTRLGTAADVIVKWEEIKSLEKKNGVAAASAVFKPLPPSLPALMFAEAVWKQIGKQRLPADATVDRDRVRALADGLDEQSLGRLLFEVTAAARERGLDSEGALRNHARWVMKEVEQRVQERPPV